MKVLFSRINRFRRPEFQIETQIIKQNQGKIVRKRALIREAQKHIADMYDGYFLLKAQLTDEHFRLPQLIERTDETIDFEFIEGNSLDKQAYEAVIRQDREQLLQVIEVYDTILTSAVRTIDQYTPGSPLAEFLDFRACGSEKQFWPVAWLDPNLDNIIIKEGVHYFIDPEWIFPATIPISFAFLRGINLLYSKYYDYNIHQIVPFSELLQRYSLSEEKFRLFSQIDRTFQDHVHGQERNFYVPPQYLQRNHSFHPEQLSQKLPGLLKAISQKQAQLFIDNGSGFSQAQSIIQPISGVESQLEFDLSNYETITGLRFDPLNDQVALRLHQIEILDANNTRYRDITYQTNAMHHKDNLLIFDVADPMIHINLPDISHTQTVLIRLDYLAWGVEIYKYISEEQAAAIQRLQDSLGQNETQIAELNKAATERERQLAGLESAITERDRQLANLQIQTQLVQDQIRAMQNTRGWRALQVWWQFKRRLLPESLKQHRVYFLARTAIGILRYGGVSAFSDRTWRWLQGERRYYRPKRLSKPIEHGVYYPGQSANGTANQKDRGYAEWITQYDILSEGELQRIKQQIKWLEHRPLISIIMPVYNTPAKYLRAAIKSVCDQLYDNWELCITDDASTESHVWPLLCDYAAKEPRIKIFRREENGHISLATNDAIALATGDWFAFMDHDDELRPHTLYEVVKVINDHPEVEVIYSDNDKITTDDVRCEPFFKPDWSPEYFRGVMYIAHILVIRAPLLAKVGYCRKEYTGVQDFELMLRVSEHTQQIYHLPKILYHWRKLANSVAADSEAKPGLAKLQEAAVNEHLARLGLPACAVRQNHTHRLTIRPLLPSSYPKISILIPTKDGADYLQTVLSSIFDKSTYKNFEVILTDNQTTQAEALDVMASFPVRVIKYDAPFNFSIINNRMVEASTGDYVVFLNVDTEVITPTWLEEMLYYAAQPDVGAVGPLLLYPDNTIQHAGIVLGSRGTADHLMRGFPVDSDGYAGSLRVNREATAVTAACLMVQKSKFWSVGGFNKHYAIVYQDVDLCLSLRSRKLRNIVISTVKLYHHESALRGKTYNYIDRVLLLDRWGPWIERGDEYYNINLDRQRLDYSLDFERQK